MLGTLLPQEEEFLTLLICLKRQNKGIFSIAYGGNLKEEKIKNENFRLGRRSQEQQVWKGPAEPLGHFPC